MSASKVLKNSSSSTGSGVACLSGMVAPASKPAFEGPGVSSTYLRPSADRGRTISVESTGTGSTCLSSLRLSRAVDSPVSDGTGVISSITPTRAPPMRTSLPFTRFAALGSWALRS